MEVRRSCMGHCVISVVSVSEILWDLVILVCSGSRSILMRVFGIVRESIVRKLCCSAMVFQIGLGCGVE